MPSWPTSSSSRRCVVPRCALPSTHCQGLDPPVRKYSFGIQALGKCKLHLSMAGCTTMGHHSSNDGLQHPTVTFATSSLFKAFESGHTEVEVEAMVLEGFAKHFAVVRTTTSGNNIMHPGPCWPASKYRWLRRPFSDFNLSVISCVTCVMRSYKSVDAPKLR